MYGLTARCKSYSHAPGTTCLASFPMQSQPRASLPWAWATTGYQVHHLLKKKAALLKKIVVYRPIPSRKYLTDIRDGPATTTTIIFKKFCIRCRIQTALDDTSHQKSMRFLCVPLCSKGISRNIQEYPKIKKWGPAT